MYRKILCTTDFSPGSRPALRAAAERATRDDAELALVYVHEPFAITLPPEVALDSRVLPSVRAHEQILLEEWQAEAAKLAGRRVTARIIDGTPWERVVHLAKEGGHDLIVVATRGRTGLAHAFIGSTTEKIVRHAGCDVLVVRS
jgi:nucleotide-binding universal stress UspA family protein